MPLDPLLVEHAARVWEESRHTCRRDSPGGESCRWHHGLWPWLRALHSSTSPARFARFYHFALREALADRVEPRVLVSGAADAEMLGCVADACPAPERAELWAIDLCETPLWASRRFAAARGLRLRTQRTDVLAFAPPRAYHAICTDSFLGQFAPAARERLVSHWARLLEPGGSLITVNRLRPDCDPERRIGFTLEQAREFCEALHAAAERLPEIVRPDLGELAHEAERYAQRQGAWPVRDAEEVRALFVRAGFAQVSIEVAPMDGGAREGTSPALAGGAPRATPPTLAGGAPYARVHARVA